MRSRSAARCCWPLSGPKRKTDQDRRRALLTFVVIGGGPTGVEMAGAIAELARRSVSRDFRSITPHCSRVILIEAGQRMLPAFPSELSAAAERSLAGLGVEVRLGSSRSPRSATAMSMSDNELIFTRTIIWAAGVQASPAAEWLGAEHDRNGRIFVERDLRVPGHAEDLRDRRYGQRRRDRRPRRCRRSRRSPSSRAVMSPTSSSAAAPAPFAYRDFGNLATIGRSQAVIDMGRSAAQRLRRLADLVVAHIWFLIGFRSRLAVDDQLAVELPHLSAQRAPDHRRDRGLPTPSRALRNPSKGNAHEIARKGSAPSSARPCSSSRAAARSALTRSASTKRCTRPGIAPRLGDRHVDRRDQRRADRRQQARTSGSKKCANSGRAFRTTI